MRRARKLQIDASLGIDGDAKLAAKGEVVPDTSVAGGARRAQRFQTAFDPALSRRVHADDAVERRVGRRARHPARASRARSTIAGSIDVAKLHTIDNALRQEFITWDRLRLVGHRILLGARAPAHRQHRGQRALRAADHRAGSIDQREQGAERASGQHARRPLQTVRTRREARCRQPVAAAHEHRHRARRRTAPPTSPTSGSSLTTP